MPKRFVNVLVCLGACVAFTLLSVTPAAAEESGTAELSGTGAPAQPGYDRVLNDAAVAATLLNRFWTAELRAQYGLVFDVPDRFEYYLTVGNPPCGPAPVIGAENAFYCFVDSQEGVAFDLDWFVRLLQANPTGAATYFILAHEWGHAVQDTWIEQQPGTDVWVPLFRQELNADCLAGAFFSSALRDGSLIEEAGDAAAIYAVLYNGGSGDWLNPGTHGTSQQRQQAFTDGLQRGTPFCRQGY